jgi:hypothetical protein
MSELIATTKAEKEDEEEARPAEIGKLHLLIMLA